MTQPSPAHRGRPRFLCCALAALACTIAGAVDAQTFPSKPVKLVVPFGPGGSSDVVARILSDGAGEAIGQPMLIENVPGAGGNIGTARSAKAAPDGYTLIECTIGTCAINPAIYPKTGYDLQKDFVPVFLVGGVMNIFTVHPSSSIQSIADLVAYAKANPGTLPTAIGAVGSSNHLTPVWFGSIAGIDMLYVPFKGAGDAITALLGAQVQFFVDNEPSILPQIKSGKVRALAVTGPKRSTYLPGGADDGRTRLQGLRRRALVRLHGAPRHAARSRGEAQRGVQHRHRQPAHHPASGRGRPAPGRRRARAARRADQERVGALGEGGEGEQHQGGVAALDRAEFS